MAGGAVIGEFFDTPAEVHVFAFKGVTYWTDKFVLYRVPVQVLEAKLVKPGNTYRIKSTESRAEPHHPNQQPAWTLQLPKAMPTFEDAAIPLEMESMDNEMALYKYEGGGVVRIRTRYAQQLYSNIPAPFDITVYTVKSRNAVVAKLTNSGRLWGAVASWVPSR